MGGLDSQHSSPPRSPRLRLPLPSLSLKSKPRSRSRWRRQRRERCATAIATAPLYATPSTLCFFGLTLPFLVLPVMLYRTALRLVAQTSRPDLGSMLPSLGSFFLRHGHHREPNGNCMLALRLEGPLHDPDGLTLKRLISERFVYAKGKDGSCMYPVLRQFLIKYGGYFFWRQEPAFSIDEHVTIRRLTLEGQGQDEGKSMHDLNAIRATFLRKPLLEGRSPWHILVVEEEEDEGIPGATATATQGHAYVWLKYHHCLADGPSLTQAFLRCAVLIEPTPKLNATVPELVINKPQMSQVRHRARWLTALAGRVRSVAAIGTELVHAMRARVQIPPSSTSIPSSRFKMAPRTFTDSESAQERIYAWGSSHDHDHDQHVSMEFVKSMAKRKGVSPTAAIYTALAGAVRKHMTEIADSGKIPNYVAFPYPLPIPTRRHAKRLANGLCAVTFWLWLPVGDPDPATRLGAIHAMINERRASAEPALTQWGMRVIGKFPHRLRPEDGAGGLGRKATWVGSSNGPGPPAPISFGGQKVVGISVGGAAFPYPFYTTFISYAGALEWTCDADKRVMSQEQLDKIARDIRHEFEVLNKMPGLEKTD